MPTVSEVIQFSSFCLHPCLFFLGIDTLKNSAKIYLHSHQPKMMCQSFPEMGKKAHLHIRLKTGHNHGKQLFVSELCLGLYLVVCWSTPTISGDYIPTDLKQQLTMNAPKKWNKYTDKLTEICLNMNLHFPVIDAKHGIVRLTKTFLMFAKRDLTLYAPQQNHAPHQISFSSLVFGRKGELHQKNVKVPTGSIFHKQYNWNVNYTFHLSEHLHSNLSICELNFGRNMKNCTFGYIHIRNTFQLHTTADSLSSFHFCGKHSPFSVYPEYRHVSVLIAASSYINGTLCMLIETIDNNVLSTLKSKLFLSTSQVLSQHYLYQARISLHIHLIQVNKDSMVCLKLHQTIGYNVKMFDGPGIESKRLDLQRKGSYVTSSFICLLFISTNGTGSEFAVHHLSVPAGKANVLQLYEGNNKILTWPKHNNPKEAHTRKIYHIQGVEYSNVNVTIDKFNVTHNKQNNWYCSQAGIVVFDHFEMQSKEILSYCEEIISSYQPKNNALSSNGSLVLVVYEFSLYTRFETEIHISISPCGSARLDPCKLYQFCTESELCVGGSRENCEHYIQAVTRSSNITLAVGQSSYQVKFTVPVGQCVLLQLIPMQETTFNFCLKQSCPFYLFPLHLKEHSDQFETITYFITGSFHGKESIYSIKENHIKLEGPTDYVSCTTWSQKQRSQSVSDNFTLKRNSYSELFSSSPCYYLSQNTRSKTFVMLIISQLLTSFGRFGLQFMFRPWIQGWVNILLRNTTQKQLFSKTNLKFLKSEIHNFARGQNAGDKYTKLSSYSLNSGSHKLENLPETPNFILYIKQDKQVGKELKIKVSVLMTVTESFLRDTSTIRAHYLKENIIRFKWEQILRFVPNNRAHSISLPLGFDSLIYISFTQNATISFQWFYGQIPHTLPNLIEVEQSENYTGNIQENMEVVYVLYSYYFDSKQAIGHFSWNRAAWLCKAIDSTLPVIRSRDEQNNILQLAKHSAKFKPAEIIFIAMSWQVLFVDVHTPDSGFCFNYNPKMTPTLSTVLCGVFLQKKLCSLSCQMWVHPWSGRQIITGPLYRAPGCECKRCVLKILRPQRDWPPSQVLQKAQATTLLLADKSVNIVFIHLDFYWLISDNMFFISWFFLDKFLDNIVFTSLSFLLADVTIYLFSEPSVILFVCLLGAFWWHGSPDWRSPFQGPINPISGSSKRPYWGDLRRLRCLRELTFWAAWTGRTKQITYWQHLPKVCVHLFHSLNEDQFITFWVFIV